MAALAVLAATGSEPAAPVKPNVLLIAVDDMNDWVRCLDGHPQSRTPNIDRLAARGTLFTNAHCQGTMCNPSRISLLWGQRPSSTGFYSNHPPFSPPSDPAPRLPQGPPPKSKFLAAPADPRFVLALHPDQADKLTLRSPPLQGRDRSARVRNECIVERAGLL